MIRQKNLYLIRHAKAEEYSFHKNDYNRNLIDKGIERAQRIAMEFSQQFTIDHRTLIISSSANRAIQTAELFSEILNYQKSTIIQEKSIYEAHYREILKVINTVSADYDNLLVFGHNPGLSDLTYYLTNTPVDLKTSHIAQLNLEKGLDFDHLSGGTANLIKVFL